jgi:hypothetical protein
MYVLCASCVRPDICMHMHVYECIYYAYMYVFTTHDVYIKFCVCICTRKCA